MQKATVVKLGFLENPQYPKEKAQVLAGETFNGVFTKEPTVGASFLLIGDHGYLRTTAVKSIYKPQTGMDKLVLPSDFPSPEKLDMPLVGEGEILFATQNSMYWVKDIESA